MHTSVHLPHRALCQECFLEDRAQSLSRDGQVSIQPSLLIALLEDVCRFGHRLRRVVPVCARTHTHTHARTHARAHTYADSVRCSCVHIDECMHLSRPFSHPTPPPPTLAPSLYINAHTPVDHQGATRRGDALYDVEHARRVKGPLPGVCVSARGELRCIVAQARFRRSNPYPRALMLME